MIKIVIIVTLAIIKVAEVEDITYRNQSQLQPPRANSQQYVQICEEEVEKKGRGLPS